MASSTRTVNVKFDGDAKGLSRAAKDGEREIDRFSKSIDKKFRQSGDASGKNFNQSLKKWFSPSSLGKAGQEGGTVFGSGFLGALKTPVLGPALAGSLLAAVAVAAPAAGAALAGGIILAAGAGLAGLGLVFAAKSKPVKDAWSATLKGMGDDMTLLSKPFEKTLISIAGFAQRTFDKFKPTLAAVFEDLAPTVTKFADQVTRGIEKLQPALHPVAEAFDAVLDKLGPATQSAIGKVSDGLVKLSDSVKRNPDGLADLVGAVGDLAGGVLILTGQLNDAYGSLKNFAGEIPIVSDVIDKAGLSAKDYGVIIGSSLVPGGNLAKNAFEGLASSADTSTTHVGSAADAMGILRQNIGTTAPKVDGLAPKVETLAQKFERQWAATQKANQELFRNSGLLLTLSGSEIAYQQAIDDATESVKENGKTHDINTQAGRNNKSALDQVAASANAQTEAMRNNSDGNVKAAAHGEAARRNFVKLAQQMGYSKTEAEKMAAKMVAIPNVSREAKLNANKKDLEKKLADANAALKDPNLTKERRAKLTVDKKNAETGIAAIDYQLRHLPGSKTITVTTVQRIVTERVERKSTDRRLPAPGRASGGPTQPKRRYLVGERGPEIAEFAAAGTGGPRILSAEKTRQELGGSSQPIIVENHIEIGGEVVRVVRSEIKTNERDTNRRVKAGVR